MAQIRGSVVFNAEQCKGCGLCADACPFKVIALAQEVNGRGYTYAFAQNPNACTGCTTCAQVCPDSVISVYRAKAGAL